MPDKIRIATADLSLTANIVFKNGRPFDHEGLSVEVVWVGVGPKVTQALLSGEVEYANVTAHPVRSAIQGKPLKYIAAYQSRGWEIWARPGIPTIFDLAGKTVAGTSPAGRRYLDAWLSDNGADPGLIKTDNNVLVNSAIDAILSGKVAAAFFMPPTTVLAETAGLKRLFPLNDMVGEMPIYGLATSDERLRAHRPQVVSMVRATLASAAELQARYDLAVKLTEELGTPAEIAARAATATVKNFDLTGVLPLRAQIQSIQHFKELDGVEGNVEPSQVFDFSIVEEVKRDSGR